MKWNDQGADPAGPSRACRHGRSRRRANAPQDAHRSSFLLSFLLPTAAAGAGVGAALGGTTGLPAGLGSGYSRHRSRASSENSRGHRAARKYYCSTGDGRAETAPRREEDSQKSAPARKRSKRARRGQRAYSSFRHSVGCAGAGEDSDCQRGSLPGSAPCTAQYLMVGGYGELLGRS